MAGKFGKYAVIDAVVYHFKVEPDWWWTIKPASSGSELEMQRFMVNGRLQVGPDGVQREYPPTTLEVAHREIALTFGGTNIPVESEKSVEAGGEPVLKEAASLFDIEAVLRQMPKPMIYEIWEAVGEANPGWGPMRPKDQKSMGS